MNLAAMLPFITALVPTLVQQAETALGAKATGATKRQWVVDATNEILAPLEKRLGTVAGALVQMAEPLIDDAINLGLTAAGL